MVAKWLKNSLNIYQIVKTLLAQNSTQWTLHLSQQFYDINFQINTKDFQSHGNKCTMDISHPWTMTFLYWSVRGVLYHLTNILRPFSVIRNHEIFVKFSLYILLVFLRQREKSQKYLDLLACNWNSNHSNLQSFLDVMNFQKWEIFSGSHGILNISGVPMVSQNSIQIWLYPAIWI